MIDTNINMSTNVVVKHNAWTFTKHLAGSVNRGIGKVDKVMYGNGTTIQPLPVRPPKPPGFADNHPIITAIGAFVLLILLIVCFFMNSLGNSGGDSKNNKIDWWPWLTP